MTLKQLILSDLTRYGRGISWSAFLKTYRSIPGFRLTFWFRVASHYRRNRLFSPILRHYHYKYGIELPKGTKVSEGFYIGHFGGIIISGGAVIGRNCNISQGVTIGVAVRGENRGIPVIGDCVYIGPGAKLIGKIRIGNNVAIGANAVVTKDVPDNAVVGGVPAKIISMNGSFEFINNRV